MPRFRICNTFGQDGGLMATGACTVSLFTKLVQHFLACILNTIKIMPGHPYIRRSPPRSSWLCIYNAPNCLRIWSMHCCLWYCALYIYIYIPGIDIHLDGHCTEKSSIHQGQILLETGADLFGKPSVRLAFRVMILLGNQNIYTICGDHRLWRYRPGFFDCFGASISGWSCSAPLGRLVTVFLVLPVACGCLDHLPPWSALEPAGFCGATRPQRLAHLVTARNQKCKV